MSPSDDANLMIWGEKIQAGKTYTINMEGEMSYQDAVYNYWTDRPNEMDKAVLIVGN